MFTGRLDTVHYYIRVAVLMRVDLTALPLVIQPPCDRLRYPVLADCVGLISYQIAIVGMWLLLPTSQQTMQNGSRHFPTQRLMRQL